MKIQSITEKRNITYLKDSKSIESHILEVKLELSDGSVKTIDIQEGRSNGRPAVFIVANHDPREKSGVRIAYSSFWDTLDYEMEKSMMEEENAY